MKAEVVLVSFDLRTHQFLARSIAEGRGQHTRRNSLGKPVVLRHWGEGAKHRAKAAHG